MDNVLRELENLRIKVAKKIYTAIFISILIAIALLIIFIIYDLTQYEFFVFLPFFCGVLSFILIYYIKIKDLHKKYIFNFKNDIVQKIIGKNFNDFTFEPNNCFSAEEIKKSYIVPIGNRYSGDDLISGTYNNVKFKQCDLCIQNHQSTGKSSTTVTYFKGKWIQFDFTQKKLDGYLQIREKEYGGAKKVSSFFSEMPVTENIKTENIKFNEQFLVKAENPHTAFYLITPQFMELVQDLCKRVQGQISIAFTNGILHIAIHNRKNAFEPPLMSPIPENIENELNQEAKIIINVIDALNLDK